jgi:hypothetical protein
MAAAWGAARFACAQVLFVERLAEPLQFQNEGCALRAESVRAVVVAKAWCAAFEVFP